MINCIPQGQLGNRMFQSSAVFLLAQKYNLKVHPDVWSYFETYNNFVDQLQPSIYSGSIILPGLKVYNEEEFLHLLTEKVELSNGVCLNGFFQLKDFVIPYREKIKKLFNPRQVEKQDDEVFIHVRARDARAFTPSLNYFEKALSKLNFNRGYISTDDPSHDTVNQLIKKYNITLFNNDPASTIAFGSSFKQIVLSGGSFSWWIGFLSTLSKVVYPRDKKYTRWHGDMFVFEDWIGETDEQ